MKGVVRVLYDFCLFFKLFIYLFSLGIDTNLAINGEIARARVRRMKKNEREKTHW